MRLRLKGMIQDFSEPQKQSAAGIVIMFADTFQKVLRAIALPLILIIVKAKAVNSLYIVLGLLLFTVLLALFAYIRYQKFTFFLDEEKQEFVINEGVFSKNTLTIQLNKIQQVNINQNLIQQIIGVYSLDIDTAGSEKKEASIKAIGHDTAIILKQKLLSKDTNLDDAHILTTEAETNAAPPLLKLSTSTLIKIGITSNYGASILLLTGFLFGLFQLFKDFNEVFEIEKDQINLALNKGFTFFSVCFLIAIGCIVVLGTNIIRTFLKYFNFVIIRQKRSLAISAGLFVKKNTLLKPNKVQLSTYSQNYFQQKFNLLNMKVKQASFDTANKEDSKKSDIEIPGCNETERNEVLKMIFDQVPVKGKPLVPNYRFLFLQVMIWIVAPLLLFILISIYSYQPLQDFYGLVIPYILIVGTMLYFEYRHHRLYVDQNFIIKKSGIWDIAHEIIEPHKIQAITSKQYFWHKSVNVGHLIIHTAAGAIHFKYGNYTHIQRLVNYWTYRVETSKKDWM